MTLAMLVTLAAPVLLAAAAPPAAVVQRADRPNVLLVITDDQGWGDLGLHGNTTVRTPHLDRLGRESIRFDRFFVSPLCAPTRASLLTGRYSLRTGAKGVSQGLETMRAGEVTVAEALRAAGYRTGLFGKWHNGEHFPYTPNGQGFDEAFGFNLGHWNRYFDSTLHRNGRATRTRGFITDVLTDAALDFIDDNRHRPFFCVLSYNAPHSPFQVPDRYFDDYKAKGLDDTLASVYGMVENVDDNVGRVLKRLDALGLRDDTLVIFLTDNGPNGARFNGGMRGTKGSLHEGGSRVPFFLRWPARFTAPRLISQIAAHIDVFPTVLELTGVPMPASLPHDGRSLVPLLHGREAGWPDRAIFTQHALPRPDRETGAVRTQQYRLVNADGRGWQLVDMSSDPAETVDLSETRPDVARRLLEQYRRWIAAVAAEAGPDRPPIPVGHAEQPRVELPAAQSTFSGGLRFSGRHPNNAWLTGWTSAAATVAWTIDVARAGTYAVGLLYLCPASDAGSRVEISARDVGVAMAIPATTGGQVDLPDRVPRIEVHEMEWASAQAGTLRLPAGTTTLTLRVLEMRGGAAMDLKAVTLERLDTAVR